MRCETFNDDDGVIVFFGVNEAKHMGSNKIRVFVGPTMDDDDGDISSSMLY